MGRKYSWQMRHYVIQERENGKTWKQIEDGIKLKFGLDKPPTLRMMQKWQKETDRDTISQMLIEETKKNIPQAGSEAIAYFKKSLLPAIWQGIEAGSDIAKVSCMWMMSVMEQTFGPATFAEALREYTQMREEAHDTHVKINNNVIKGDSVAKHLQGPSIGQSGEESQQ